MKTLVEEIKELREVSGADYAVAAAQNLRLAQKNLFRIKNPIEKAAQQLHYTGDRGPKKDKHAAALDKAAAMLAVIEQEVEDTLKDMKKVYHGLKI